jgi:hypothetical protein
MIRVTQPVEYDIEIENWTTRFWFKANCALIWNVSASAA